jgi:hypothetical protein
LFQSVAADHQGGMVAAGRMSGTVDLGGGPLVSPGGYKALVASFAADGSHRYSHMFGSQDSQSQSALAVGVDQADDVVIAGSNDGSPVDFGGGAIGGEIFLVKLSPEGQHLWSYGFSGTEGERITDLAIAADGSIVLAGFFAGTLDVGGGPMTSTSSSPDFDAFVARYDAGGTFVWSRALSTASRWPETQVAIGPDGSVHLAAAMAGAVDFDGTTVSGNGVVLAKLGADGAHIWSRALLTDELLSPGDLAIGIDGAVVLTGLAGGHLDFGDGPYDAHGSFLAKYGPDGQPAWNRVFGSSNQSTNFNSNWGVAVRMDACGDVVMFANADYVDYGGGVLGVTGVYQNGEIALAHFDGNGTHLWSNAYGSADSDVDGDMDLAADGTLVLGGSVNIDDALDFGGDAIFPGPAFGAGYIAKLHR